MNLNDPDYSFTASEHIVWFDDLLKEIAYAYEEDYPIRKDKDGIYHIHKLSIGREFAQYKTSIYKLDPKLYNQLEKFFNVKFE